MTSPLVPRGYQTQLIQKASKLLAANKRVLVVSPAASGKTVVIAQLACRALRNQERALVLAHLRSIVPQIWNHCLRSGIPEKQLSLMMADALEENYAKFRPGAAVTVASIQTYRSRVLDKRESLVEDPDLIIVDEAHHVLASTYRRLLRRYPKAKVVGLTAFSKRLDGKGLGNVFDTIVEGPTHNQLIESGVLSRPRIWVAPEEYLPDLEDVLIQMGDYNKTQLEDVMDQNVLIGNVVEHYAMRGQGRPGVTFAVGIRHSKNLADRYNGVGIRAEHLDGEMPYDKREAILKRLRKGTTRIICSCMALGEGWDEPSVRVVTLARPTRSEALYLNQAGRGMRYYRGIRPVILDHSRNVVLHGVPHAERAHDLEDSAAQRKRNGSSKAKVCPSCGAAADVHEQQCPECGEQFPVPVERSDPEELEVELVELTKQRWNDRYKKLIDFGAKKGWAIDEARRWADVVMVRWMGAKP